MADRGTFPVDTWVRLAARYVCEWHCDCCQPGGRTHKLPNGTLGRVVFDDGASSVAVLIDGAQHTLPHCSHRSLVPAIPTPDEETEWLIHTLSR